MSDFGRYLAFWPMPRGRANRAIDAGDLARNAGQWGQAAAHYRRAVTIQPGRHPIWVQLGHAEKEAGYPEAALEAYRRAMLLPGEDGDGALHHGLQARALGLFMQAKVSLTQSVRQRPDHADARREWQEILHHPLAASEEDKTAAALLLKADGARSENRAGASALVFEVTDLLSHFRRARLPTGVQRVQMAVIGAAIDLHPGLRICSFAGADTGWVLIPVQQFLGLCAMAQAGGDVTETAWIRAVELLAATVALAAPVGFAAGDVLVNLGTSWTLPNYFLHLRHARRRWSIAYVPFVHDLIPVVAPDTCLPDVVRDFLEWIGGVFDHADRFLTNSRSTAADLGQVAALLGHRPGEGDVEIVPLDAALDTAMPQGPGTPLPATALAPWALSSGGYVLFVSSIEPRKNHRMALRAWQRMIARDEAGTPDLVCVGHGGWLNDPVHAMLRDDPVLSGKVRVLSGIADEELALLYRHCRFTLYPSLYEGWGMPVTESLCHGKVPVITRSSSLTEAGGDFAVYVAPDDDAGLAEAVWGLWHDGARLRALEGRIAEAFRPRTWADVARQVCDAVQDLVPVARPDAPVLLPDTLYRLGRNRAMHLVPGAERAEMLRQDLGWAPLETGAARTRAQGGRLAFRVEDGRESLACHLRAAGAPQTVRTALGEWAVDVAGWLSIEAPVVDGRVDLWLSGGATLSHLLISDAADRVQVAPRMAGHGGSDYAFLRDVHPLLTGEEADAAVFAEFLPSLEAGGLTRAEVIALLRARSDRQAG